MNDANISEQAMEIGKKWVRKFERKIRLCSKWMCRWKLMPSKNVRKPFTNLCMINNFSVELGRWKPARIHFTNIHNGIMTHTIWSAQMRKTKHTQTHKALTYRKFNIIIYGTKMKCHQLCWCNLNKLCCFLVFALLHSLAITLFLSFDGMQWRKSGTRSGNGWRARYRFEQLKPNKENDSQSVCWMFENMVTCTWYTIGNSYYSFEIKPSAQGNHEIFHKWKKSTWKML